MTDPHEALEQLDASPQLHKAWQKARQMEYACAWHLLNHNWLIPPEIPREWIPHNPRVRIWEEGSGGRTDQSVTLMVFVGMQSQCRCRQAIWEDAQQIRHRLIEFVNRQGEVPIVEPTFSIRDARFVRPNLLVCLLSSMF